MLLEGKRVIVTGGATGIGKATVLGMVREGAAVVSVSRVAPTDARAIHLVDAARKLGAGPVTHMQMDVTKQAEVNGVFDLAAEFMGGLDGLVNSAGIVQEKPAEDLVEKDLYDQFAVHVFGTAFTSAAAWRYMQSKGGSIINYSSFAGVGGSPMMATYSAAKAAVIGYTRVIAKEWGRYWIRVNAVCPGVKTELAEEWYRKMSPERFAEIAAFKKATIPLGGDTGSVEDAANLNVFLVSNMSRFITGQLVGVDGGMTMGR